MDVKGIIIDFGAQFVLVGQPDVQGENRVFST
jgi:hypothetical protein